MKTFSLDIVTPQGGVFQAQAVSVVVPAQRGYLGILADHASLIANLVPGKISIRDDGGKDSAFLSKAGGFVEVFKNQVHIFVDEILKEAAP